MKFNHILVATDGSARADKAVDMALQLAGDAAGCRVTALMVVPDYTMHDYVATVFGPSEKDFSDVRRRLADAGARRLAAVLERHRAQDVRAEALVAVSDYPYDEIVQHAQRLGCDLIVMASHGHGAVASALLGSQTTHVVAQARVPVLVVR